MSEETILLKTGGHSLVTPTTEFRFLGDKSAPQKPKRLQQRFEITVYDDDGEAVQGGCEWRDVPTEYDVTTENETDRYVGSGFRKELQHVINKCSMENGSDTPDFILAEYLTDCLRAFDHAVFAKRNWGEVPKVDTTLDP